MTTNRIERMAREQQLRVKQQQEQDAIDARKRGDARYKITLAISARDALRDLACVNSVDEVELHRIADRLDTIAKQIGLAALTLKAAGALAPARTTRDIYREIEAVKAKIDESFENTQADKNAGQYSTKLAKADRAERKALRAELKQLRAEWDSLAFTTGRNIRKEIV